MKKKSAIHKKNNFRLSLLVYVFAVSLLSFGSFGIEKYSAYSIRKELTSSEYKMKLLAQTGEYQEGLASAVFNNSPVNTVQPPLADTSLDVLGIKKAKAAPENKWIEIDLSEQRLKAWEGDQLVYDFLVSTGKWGLTPVGEFRIWTKLKYTLMAGGSKALNTYYYLPNVPYTQYFYGGYGIHGTYWHSNFGHPMSHGCINMYTPEAEKLFYWTQPYIPPEQYSKNPTKEDPGTRVVIHE